MKNFLNKREEVTQNSVEKSRLMVNEESNQSLNELNGREVFSEKEITTIAEVGAKALEYLSEIGIEVSEDDKLDFYQAMFELLCGAIDKEGVDSFDSIGSKEYLAFRFAYATIMSTDFSSN